jgi:hypothetical protein
MTRRGKLSYRQFLGESASIAYTASYCNSTIKLCSNSRLCTTVALSSSCNNSSSGESKGGTKVTPPVSSVVGTPTKAFSPSKTNGTSEKSSGALLLQMLSNPTIKGGSSGDSFLTDKEISSKAIAAASSKISTDDVLKKKLTTTSTSTSTSSSSSSFLKSMLNVAPPVTTIPLASSPDAKGVKRTPPPPLSASLHQLGSASNVKDQAPIERPVEPPAVVVAMEVAVAVGVAAGAGAGAGLNLSQKTESKAPLSKIESPNGKASNGGLEPGIFKLRRMASNGSASNVGISSQSTSSTATTVQSSSFLPVPIILSSPSPPVSVPSIPSPISISSPPSAHVTPPGEHSLKPQNSSPASYMGTHSPSASAILLASLSIQSTPPATTATLNAVAAAITAPAPTVTQTPQSIPERTPLAEVSTSRRMSVSQLFQTRTNGTTTICEQSSATTATTMTGGSQVVEVTIKKEVSVIPVSVATTSTSVGSGASASEAQPIQEKERSPRSTSLFNFLKIPPKANEITEASLSSSSVRSVAIPLPVPVSKTPSTSTSAKASAAAVVTAQPSQPSSSAPQLVHTPINALLAAAAVSRIPATTIDKSGNIVKVDLKALQRSTSAATAAPVPAPVPAPTLSSSFSAPSSFYAAASAPSAPCSEPLFSHTQSPQSLSPHTTARTSSPPSIVPIPAPAPLTPPVSYFIRSDPSITDAADIIKSPSSYSASALSQYLSTVPGISFNSGPGSTCSTDTPPARTPSEIPEPVRARTPAHISLPMKCLSPSDLTGYIRKF